MNNDFEGMQLTAIRRREMQQEAELERLARLARSLDDQKRSTGLLRAVLEAARGQLKGGTTHEIVPVTVLATD